ncbi:rhodanese-like domain-containing protein [Kiritimatiellaeota bacterium B1221]|nr:rhodanese-like domain-containing protein [Kiritimatiellaeota bacterium B1221]
MSDVDQIPPESLPDSHPYLILDVREPSEYDFVHIPGSVLLPLGELSLRYHQLPEDRSFLCLCHHGIRSQRAAQFLAGKGFKAANLQGGIDRWSLKKDPSLPRY